MPKNKGKGGKNRRRGKNENDDVKRELTLREEGQAYAQVMKMLGNGRLEALCLDNNKLLLCHIRGKLRKKVWINTADIILIGLRDFQETKADVILKYNADEARVLKNKGQIPENVNIMDASQFGQDNGGDDIYFDEFDESANAANGGNVGSDSSSDEDDIDDDNNDGDDYDSQDDTIINNNNNINNKLNQKQKQLNKDKKINVKSAVNKEERDNDDDDDDDDDDQDEEREQDEGDIDLYMSGYGANNNRKSNAQYIGNNRSMKQKSTKQENKNDDLIDRI